MGEREDRAVPESSLRLNGRVALITGASGGIGAATAVTMQALGARLALVDHPARQAELSRLAGQLGGHPFLTEASDAEGAVQTAKQVGRTVGPIDILINLAGITGDGVCWKLEPSDFMRVLAVNLGGSFNFVRAVVPGMRERKRGVIVNVASINGLRGRFGQSAYTASKAGIVGLTRTLARELGPSGVRAVCVCPGFIRSPMTAAMPSEARARSISEIPLGRAGEPEEVAGVIAFLASDLATFVNGAVIAIDGGQVA